MRNAITKAINISTPVNSQPIPIALITYATAMAITAGGNANSKGFFDDFIFLLSAQLVGVLGDELFRPQIGTDEECEIQHNRHLISNLHVMYALHIIIT